MLIVQLVKCESLPCKVPEIFYYIPLSLIQCRFYSQYWAATTSIQDLFKFQTEKAEEKNRYLHSAMFELTSNLLYITIHPMVGNRGLASRVNPLLHDYYAKKKHYTKANIVATDYVLDNDIITLCIEANKLKQ